jgi:D-alanyl-D-alanine dipeptidase
MERPIFRSVPTGFSSLSGSYIRIAWPVRGPGQRVGNDLRLVPAPIASPALYVAHNSSQPHAFHSQPLQISAIIPPVLNRQAVSISKFFLVLAFCPLLAPALLHAQTAVPATSLTPGRKPPDVSPEWKQLVGIYGPDKHVSILLERGGKLFWRTPGGVDLPLEFDGKNRLVTSLGADERLESAIEYDSNGSVTGVLDGNKVELRRADAGSDPAHFYHVTPTRPLAEIRAEALRASPPVEPGPFRQPDLVELTTLDPAFHLDIRYAQSNNFLSTPSYTQARAFMQRPAAEALLRALKKLQPLGYGLLIHDAYRPWYVTKIFWDATPPEGHDFVADPQKGSKHNRGCAVDITLYDFSTGQPIEMPGLYDEMSPRSFPTFPGGTSLQRWHRDLLRRAIESEGFTVDGNEWWHYDYRDWKQYPILNVPFEKLGKS